MKYMDKIVFENKNEISKLVQCDKLSRRTRYAAMFYLYLTTNL